VDADGDGDGAFLGFLEMVTVLVELTVKERESTAKEKLHFPPTNVTNAYKELLFAFDY
jgi:hypothetical protein